MTDVILERELDEALSREDVLAMADEAHGCFAIYRVDWHQSFLAAGGRRLICWFSAPDVDSARAALRQSGVQDFRLWPATVRQAPGPDAPIWHQANVIVERSWEEPVLLDDIQAIEDAGASCLETRQVRFSATFFSTDRRAMVCLYSAPDAEAVRQAQRQAGMPLDSVWACRQVRDLV